MDNSKYQVEVRVKFRYGHRLMPPYVGKCNNCHGEGGIAIIKIEKEYLDKNGMVIDFGEAKKIISEWIMENFDHAYLHRKDDEVGEFLRFKGLKTYSMNDNPTAENMAKLLFCELSKKIPYIKEVGIVESFEDSIAWFKN